MSVYSELVNEWDYDPVLNGAWIQESILADEFQPWDLPKIDLLEIWGPMTLRQAFGMVSGGDTPTTYSKRMALAIRAITDPASSLLGLEEEPVDADYTRVLETIASLRAGTVDAEVLDDGP